ncbi:MAG: ATP-dependent helicase/nuclease subunit A [Holosporales bacterium]
MNPQTLASNPKISAFVMASAGTGKTKMLVDRLIRLLLNGMEISAILCLTFTKAAAQEMVHRLFSRLEDFTKMTDDALRHHLNDLNEPVHFMEKARTLYFTLLDQQHLLKIKTLHSFCQSILEAHAWDVGLIPPFQLVDDDQKKILIEKALDACMDDIQPFCNIMGYSTFMDYVENALSLETDVIEKSLNPLELPKCPDSLDNLCAQLPEHLRQTVSSDLFLTKEGTIRKRIYKKADVDAYPHLEILMPRIASYYLYERDTEKIQKLNSLNHAFFTLIQRVKKAYEQEKQKKSLLDFDDLIIKTNILLKSNPHIEQKLGYSIQAILLDEAQDTSPAQWAVVTTLTECLLIQDAPLSSLFVVGDLKQSIYSFQGADPSLFIEKQDTFKTLFAHNHKPFEILSLQKSYRCAPRILKTVDNLFNQHPDGLFLADPLCHIPHRLEAGHVEKHPLMIKEKDDTWQLPHQRIEEDGLPKKILACVQDVLKKGYAPKDILILVRSRAPFIDPLMKLFSCNGVPCAGIDRFLLKDHPMTRDFLNLLGWLCHKTISYNLLQILKTFGQRTDQALYDALQEDPDLWNCMQEEDPLKIFLKDCLYKVDYALNSQLISFIWHNQKTYFLMQYGLEANSIYETFYDVCYKIEQEKTATLQDIVWLLESQDFEVKRDVSCTDIDQVRLLTVHGSKGLEAPIVILADTNFRQTLQKERLMRYKDQYLIKPSDADTPSFLKAHKDQALNLLKAEEKRLLYVALTRARDALFVFGKGTLVEQSWYDLLCPHIDDTTTLVDKPQYDHAQKPDPIDIPDYFFQPLPPLQNESPYDQKATNRGILIHACLERLASVNVQNRKDILKTFPIDDIDQDNILWFFETNAPLFDFPHFFEFPIVHNNALMRLDLFIKKPNEGIIIDFKTGKKSDTKKKMYSQQLDQYQQALSKIYPDLMYQKFLVWMDEKEMECIST